MDVLFFGDLVGRPGRQAFAQTIAGLRQAQQLPNVVIANAENVSHGFGLMQKHYDELLAAGADILTGGNHIWDRKDLLDYIHQADRLLRPHNMSTQYPGRGYGVFTVGQHKIGVINLIGQVFMGNYNAPWEDLEAIVASLKAQTPIIFVDLHAEATAEKLTLAHYLCELGVSAMVGTHTHVQTADEQILTCEPASGGLHQMGYLTDAGFNGARHSVIGMTVETARQRMLSPTPCRLEVAETGPLQVNAVRFTLDVQTGQCLAVSRLNQLLQTVDALQTGASEKNTTMLY